MDAARTPKEAERFAPTLRCKPKDIARAPGELETHHKQAAVPFAWALRISIVIWLLIGLVVYLLA